MGYLQKKPRVSLTSKPTILIDTREKHPWRFNGFKYPVITVNKKLNLGDYSVKGFTDILAVERKAGINEIIVNISKQDRARFIKVLERLSNYRFKYLVIEGCISDTRRIVQQLPVRAKVNEASVYYWLNRIIGHYKIPIVWLGKTSGMQQKILNSLWEHILECDLKGKA